MVQASIVLLFFFPFLVFLLSPSFSFMGAFSFAFFAGKRKWDSTIQLHSKREKKLFVHTCKELLEKGLVKKSHRRFPYPSRRRTHTKGKGSEGEMKLTLKGEVVGW